MVMTAEIAAGGAVCWATDLNAGGAALLNKLLALHTQQMHSCGGPAPAHDRLHEVDQGFVGELMFLRPRAFCPVFRRATSD